jgi:hypothetical protein
MNFTNFITLRTFLTRNRIAFYNKFPYAKQHRFLKLILMNKDAILASVIGFGIGLLITGAVLIGPTALPMLKKTISNIGKGSVQSLTTQVSPTPTSVAPDAHALTIDSPEDQSITNSDTLTITGKAPKDTLIVVDGNIDESVVSVSSTNTFQAEIGLKEGVNDISVTNLTKDKPTNKHFTVYYTPKS